MAVADHLAAQGAEVLIVGAQPVLAPEMGRRAKTLPLARMEGNPRVRILLDVKLQGIRRDRILGCGPAGRERIATTGPVLVSQGVRPVRPSVSPYPAPRLGVQLVGEAKAPRRPCELFFLLLFCSCV